MTPHRVLSLCVCQRAALRRCSVSSGRSAPHLSQSSPGSPPRVMRTFSCTGHRRDTRQHSTSRLSSWVVGNLKRKPSVILKDWYHPWTYFFFYFLCAYSFQSDQPLRMSSHSSSVFISGCSGWLKWMTTLLHMVVLLQLAVWQTVSLV